IPGKFELTVELTRLLFPFLILISWSALFMGILNSFRKFALPSLGPAVMNLTIILLTPILLSWGFVSNDYRIHIYSGVILVGVFLQTAIQLPALYKLKAGPKLSFKL